MKLENIQNNTIYMTSGRDLFTWSGNHKYEHLGTLPNPSSRYGKIITNRGLLGKLQRKVIGEIHNVNIWSLDESTLLATVTNHLYRSSDKGQTWYLVKELHKSSGVRGVLPNGLCFQNGTILLGEYIFDESRSPRIFASDDFGVTWRTELVLDGVRHVHAIQNDPYTDEIWVTTGDRDDESMIGQLRDGELKVIGTGSQRWRTVELAFTEDFLLWGTDSPYQKNHILKVSRDELQDNPEPVSMYSVDEPFYYSTSADINGERLTLFSTGGGFGTDSTAPESISQTVPTRPQIGVYGSTSSTGFSEWIELTNYGVKERLPNRLGYHSFAANAYIFLKSSPHHGIFVNPINTFSNDGIIHHIKPHTINEYGFTHAFADL